MGDKLCPICGALHLDDSTCQSPTFAFKVSCEICGDEHLIYQSGWEGLHEMEIWATEHFARLHRTPMADPDER